MSAPARTPQIEPMPAEDHHAEEEDRELEEEVRGERARAIAREVGAGDTAEERADRVRPRLRPHQRHAHRRGRRLVLADRDPRPPEPRVAEADAAEDGEEHEPDRHPVEEVVLVRLLAEHEARSEGGRVDRRDPEGSVREVEAPDRVGVPDELRHDLAEAERHDREVVTAKPERREPDDDADDRGEDAGEDEHEPHGEMDAGKVAGRRRR